MIQSYLSEREALSEALDFVLLFSFFCFAFFFLPHAFVLKRLELVGLHLFGRRKEGEGSA